MTDTVLDIHNVKQKLDVESVEVKKTFGQELMSKVIDHQQEELENGNIKITLILDPTIKGIKNV